MNYYPFIICRPLVDYQIGRRNITPEQQSYLRGVQYEREKGKQGGDRKSDVAKESKGKNYPLIDVSEKLATQHKVAAKTIKNDAQYARAVNAVDKAAGNGAKTALLSRDTKVSKQDAVKLGAIAESNPQTVRNVLQQVEESESQKVASIVQFLHNLFCFCQYCVVFTQLVPFLPVLCSFWTLEGHLKDTR